MGLKWESPLYPPSIRDILEAPLKADVYAGKKILSIHGGSDTLVPLSEGKADLDEIVQQAKPGDVEVWVQEGVGHQVTEEMIRKTAEWVWKWAVKPESRATSSL